MNTIPVILTTKLKNAFKKTGLDLEFDLSNIVINKKKVGCNGFVKNKSTNTIVYINTEAGTLNKYLFRLARHFRDYTGERNHFAQSLDDLINESVKLLKLTVSW